MKKLFFLIVFLFASALTFAQSQVWVNGYTRSNGSYVQGHYRTGPDNTRNNNWTTVGNVNPHTGKNGTLPGDGNSRATARTDNPSDFNQTPLPQIKYQGLPDMPKTTPRVNNNDILAMQNQIRSNTKSSDGSKRLTVDLFSDLGNKPQKPRFETYTSQKPVY